MKNIMIYTRRSEKINGMHWQLKTNAHMIILFTAFICGIMLGCTLFLSVKEDSMLYYALNSVLRLSDRQIGKSLAIAALSITAVCSAAGLSCCGAPIILLVPMINGIVFGAAAGRFITVNTNGLPQYTFMVLPWGVLWCSAVLIMCCICEKHSVIVAKTICLNHREHISIKDYFVNMALLCGVLLGSVGLLILCIKLFGGLLE